MTLLDHQDPDGPWFADDPVGGPRPLLDRRWWTPLRGGIAAGAVLVLAVATAGVIALQRHQADRLVPVQPVPTVAAPARGWPSGVWTGGDWGPDQLADFGTWRGSKVDTTVNYPSYDTWKAMKDSDWNVGVFAGFPGMLVYGLPLLPKDGSGTLAEVAAGAHDDAFTAVAATLLKYQRGDSYIRIGLEANGDWFPWGVGKEGNDAASFKAAFRHVAVLLRTQLPQAKIVFDIGCGHAMNGQSHRLDSLTTVYPGDDVVDVVGCDAYDSYSNVSRTAEQFGNVLRPENSAGLQDVVDFARAHGKKWAVPEWGLTGAQDHGGGDNPFFIYSMYQFFAAHAKDLAFEDYFNEPDSYLQSSIWKTVQQPAASAEYRRLW